MSVLFNPKNQRFFTSMDGDALVIHDHDIGGGEVGRYTRNYGPCAEETFHPFKTKGGEWFALYSEDYTETAVMSLPDCKKVAVASAPGGESNCFDGTGFCPVRFFVPAIYLWGGGRYLDEVSSDLEEDKYLAAAIAAGDWWNVDFAVAYGCFWACPFEVTYIDMSKLAEGVVTMSWPFDPHDIPSKMEGMPDALERIVSVQVSEEDGPYAINVLSKHYRFHKGTRTPMTPAEWKAEIESWRTKAPISPTPDAPVQGGSE